MVIRLNEFIPLEKLNVTCIQYLYSEEFVITKSCYIFPFYVYQDQMIIKEAVK